MTEARRRNEARRHCDCREMRQDMPVAFIGSAVSQVMDAARHMKRTARGIGIAVCGRPERRDSLPPGHPPPLGSEGVKYAIMTVRLECSMAQAVDLPKRDMQFGMSVVPIPKVRYYSWLKRQAAARRRRTAGGGSKGRRCADTGGGGRMQGARAPWTARIRECKARPRTAGMRHRAPRSQLQGVEALRRGPSVQPPARAAGKRSRAECRRNLARRGGAYA